MVTRETLFIGCCAVNVLPPSAYGSAASTILILRVETLAHDRCPHTPRGAELCHLFKKLIVGVEEESELRRKIIHVESSVYRRLYILNTIRQCKGNFLHGGAARFTDVIARDADRVPLGTSVLQNLKDIGDEAH